MNRLQQFVELLTGSFDNREQYEQMQKEGNQTFPLARHVNTACNDKITGLPQDFDGVFVLEESYYTVGERTNASPHLFLFTMEGEAVKLTSYEMPEGYDKDSFTYQQLKPVAFDALKPSAKFTPALYHECDGVWEGGSESMFSPVLKFTLFERFSNEGLEVSESMEVNGKRTFGYDVPILYRRVQRIFNQGENVMWKFDDDKTAAVITAREHVACGHNRQDSCPALVLPETAILFYMHSGPQYLQEHYPCTLLTEKLPRFLQGGPVWKLDEKICFLDGGRGAPQAVDTIETLAVLGVKRVVTVGMCGGFSEQVAVGDILVPDKAFVEEGTSLHYYEQIDFARPDEQLFEQLQNIPEAKVLPIVTTDAVYRQTFYKEQLWREKGAVAVDMETSALWSVGKFLGLQVASVLMISDCHPLREGESAWEWKMTMEMRRRLFEQVMEIVFSA